MNELYITETAKKDIKEALNYIKNTLFNPLAATNLANEITDQISMLKTNPKSGPLDSDIFLSDAGIRFLLIKNYKVFYKLEETKNITRIFIIRFLHSKQEYKRILNE